VLDSRPARLPWIVGAAVAAAGGAVLAFLLDPQMGRTRRAVFRDRVAGATRGVARVAGRQGRWLGSTAAGMAERARSTTAPREPLDEVGLAHKVESILFRDPDVDKGAINVNAESDLIFLRGTAASHEAIADIVRRVQGISGVREVVNLLRVADVLDQPSTGEAGEPAHAVDTPAEAREREAATIGEPWRSNPH
jgi:hypothetical protein